VTPNNIEGLQKMLTEVDKDQSGFLSNDAFVRCLSQSQMKVTDREVAKLIEELDAAHTGKINYRDFLKYSYLCTIYLKHFNLEIMLNELDKEKKGLITVEQLDKILQSSSEFNFPP
jgi:Ca2+-binding EF-hand superfamily protein